MKINNYPTYIRKKWKKNKGRFVNNQKTLNDFILPLDDVDLHVLELQLKIKTLVKKEYENIYTYKFHNAEMK